MDSSTMYFQAGYSFCKAIECIYIHTLLVVNKSRCDKFTPASRAEHTDMSTPQINPFDLIRNQTHTQKCKYKTVKAPNNYDSLKCLAAHQNQLLMLNHN